MGGWLFTMLRNRVHAGIYLLFGASEIALSDPWSPLSQSSHMASSEETHSPTATNRTRLWEPLPRVFYWLP